MLVQYHESDVKHHKPSHMQNKFWSAGSWYRPLVFGKTRPPKQSKFGVQYSSMLILSVSENCLLESECFKKMSKVYPFTKQDICIYIGHFVIHLISLILVFFLCCQMWGMYCWPFRSTRVHPFSGVHVARSLVLCVCFVEHILCSVLFFTILLFVLHWLTAYYYPCGIFKLFVFTEKRRQMV